MNNKYYIYKHTFPNGKIYIGITRQNKPEDRWMNGRGYNNKCQIVMWRAIQKYGWKSIKHEILHDGLEEQEAKELEVYYITQVYHSNLKQHGYNQTIGGDGVLGYFHTDETRDKISQASKRMWSDLKFRKKMSANHSGDKNANYGKHISIEQKNLLSQLARERIGGENPFYGKFHSYESKQKISRNRTGKNCGFNNPNSKQVRCIETGEVFESASIAAKKYSKSPSNITSACRGNSHTAYGYHWEYVKQNVNYKSIYVANIY